MKIRIIVADDHPAVLAAIHHTLLAVPVFDVVGTARDSSELVQLLQHQPCDVLVTDYAMPGGGFCDGIPLITHIRDNHPDVKIIVFSALNNPALNMALSRLGVQAVLNKTSDTRQLVTAVHAVQHGDKRTRTLPVDTLAAKQVLLSKREEEVIQLFVSGLSVNEIADCLGRTKQTISSQKSNAMIKLGVTRDADLFHFALETGLVSLTPPTDQGQTPGTTPPPNDR